MVEIDSTRIRQLNAVDLSVEGTGPVVYWMDRDQRSRDNWALLYAQQIALELARPLMVVFCVTPGFQIMPDRQYDFMVSGLQQLDRQLRSHHIPLILLVGDPVEEVPSLAEAHTAAALVTDFSPLRMPRRWRQGIADRIACPAFEVDAHNIVPCWQASDKREYAAYTLRPRINRQLPEYLTRLPELVKHPIELDNDPARVDWDKARASARHTRIEGSHSNGPGERAGLLRLEKFLETGLNRYASGRNDPNAGAQSGLSPYLHFGQLSAHRVAWEVRQRCDPALAEAFLEELVVRRELSDNYCYYCPDYDTVRGFPGWSLKTLDDHRDDPRQYLYGPEQLESADTHDPLWNACQKEMVITGSMPGYLRMYWAKKILQWSPGVEQALATAIDLNDRYELDGNDPNGYAGIAWSIGGVHDRAWPERDVFGKIRYMSYEGCRRKFNVDAYIERVARVENSGR